MRSQSAHSTRKHNSGEAVDDDRVEDVTVEEEHVWGGLETSCKSREVNQAQGDLDDQPPTS